MPEKRAESSKKPEKKPEMPKIQINPELIAELDRQFEEGMKIGAASAKVKELMGQSKPRF